MGTLAEYAVPQKLILVRCLMIGLGKGFAGVCINGVEPKGSRLFNWNFIKADLPLINPFKGDSVFIPGATWFSKFFTKQ